MLSESVEQVLRLLGLWYVWTVVLDTGVEHQERNSRKTGVQGRASRSEPSLTDGAKFELPELLYFRNTIFWTPMVPEREIILVPLCYFILFDGCSRRHPCSAFRIIDIEICFNERGEL